MTDAWDGIPQNPERDGWHWLRISTTIGPSVWEEPVEWVGREAAWRRLMLYVEPHEMATVATYLGPCLTPAQAATLLARAEKAEAERDAAMEARE